MTSCMNFSSSLGSNFSVSASFRILCFCTVVGFDMRVGLMLRFVRSLVLKWHEGLGDVVEHGDMDPTAIIVPIHVHSKVACFFQVDRAFAIFVENFCKMVCVLPSHILDAEVVDTERGRDGLPIVFQKVQRDLAFMVAV